MDIHELPSGTATTSDYIAADNGTSTRKIQLKGFDIGYNEVIFESLDNNTPQATSWQEAQALTSGLSLKVILKRATALLSNVRYLYNRIGTTSIGGSAVTITSAIKDIIDFIGSTTMTTTATTITGAIKELKQFDNSLPDFSSYQTASTSWSIPSPYSSNCTISSGGYFTEGKHVYVQMRLTLAATLAADTNLQICENMPKPSPTNAVFNVAFGFAGGGNAFVNTSGDLYLRSPGSSVSTSTNIYITGHYVTA